MSHILASKLDCQCGGKSSPIDSVIAPITQELKCMQMVLRKVRRMQMIELIRRETEMYETELRALNLSIWSEVGHRSCK
ncbi:uncharacterized protein LOC119551470 [Drosophila subpulchrella]|uniref:uncharacterized protein LOC119551470 n=1 Tax=Drosophila subpulchrella TaxID=1486046 RepID=UPI0018A1388E|nr:uncharacterized protein LOC119551470 [Drosophila subpulchrella]